jgi:peptidoglycan hydrolase-like protein with peptidoglycan-binding domain
MVGNRLRCDLGSKSAECVGSSTARSTSTTRNTSVNTPTVKSNAYKIPTKYKPTITSLPDDIDSKIVIRIQKRLKLIGLYEGSVDGVFGPSTALAIDMHKVKNGIPIGQYFDENTLLSLGIIKE